MAIPDSYDCNDDDDSKNMVKSHKVNSENYTPPTSAPPAVESDNGAQRDYDIPIPSI